MDAESVPLHERWFWISIPLVLCLLPFTIPIQTGQMAGAGPDVVSTVWAMWWFQQEWTGPAWGGDSTLFNFPFGGNGAILSPLYAVLWSVFDGIFGPSWGTTLTDYVVLLSMYVGMVAIARKMNCSRLVASCAGMLVLLPRYTIFTLGETGVVGVAMFPILLGIYAILSWEDRNIWKYILVLCISTQSMENPYLALVLPIISILYWFIYREKQLDVPRYVLIGLVGMGVVAYMYHSASGSYESVIPTSYTQLFSLHFPAVERTWARSTITEMFTANSVIWPGGSMDSIHMRGRQFLGYSGILLALASMIVCRKQPIFWLWMGTAVFGLLLVTGSDWNGYPSVFGILNSVASQIVRPFTQPSRYFVLYSLGVGLGITYFLQNIQAKHIRYPILCWLLLVGESVWWGGLSLRIPSSRLPDQMCMDALRLDGPVLVFPWDGADDQWFESTLQSRLFQIVHEQPGATIGTGSWPLEGVVFPGALLRDLGWRAVIDGKGGLDITTLGNWGYKYAIVDTSVGRVLTRRMRDDVFGMENTLAHCPGYDVYTLSTWKATEQRAITHPYIKQNRQNTP